MALSASKKLSREQHAELRQLGYDDLLNRLGGIETVLHQCGNNRSPCASPEQFPNSGYIMKSSSIQLKQVDSDDARERERYIAEYLERMPFDDRPFDYAIQTECGEKTFEKVGSVYHVYYPDALPNQFASPDEMTGILLSGFGTEWIECTGTRRRLVGNQLWWESKSCMLQKEGEEFKGFLRDTRFVANADGSGRREIVNATYGWNVQIEEITE